MKTKYRLLKDLPGISAGMIIDAQAQPIEHFAPVLSLHDRAWFEPVEDDWKPEYGAWYWRVDSTGEVSRLAWRNDKTDTSLHAFGNCFRTEALAELAAPLVRQCFLQFHREHGDA